MAYKIEIEAFEGPFDLLLHLIQVNEIDIYNIPIHEITQQYMAYIDDIEKLDMDLASEFLVMAATLLEIKSKMLLPNHEEDALYEQFDLDDPRQDLVRKLVEYKQYRGAATFLKDREDSHSRVVFKEQEDLSPYVREITNEELNQDLDAQLLVEAVQRILRNLNKEDSSRKGFFHKLQRDLFTVDEKMDQIREKLQSFKRFAFTALFGEEITRNEVIVTFLAILEMLKLKEVKLQQDQTFGDIHLLRMRDQIGSEIHGEATS